MAERKLTKKRYLEIIKSREEDIEKLASAIWEKNQKNPYGAAADMLDFFGKFEGDEGQMAALTAIFIAGIGFYETKMDEAAEKKKAQQLIAPKNKKGGLPN